MAAVVVRSSVFRDTDQNNRLLSILNEQRATSRFCDVILKVREDHIFAHSNVLAAASPYFGSFLGLGADSPRAFCEKSPQVIEIQIDGADSGSGYGDAVRHVVEYMYTCSLELNSIIISQIAEIARIMQVQRVLDYCDRFLKGESGANPLLDKRALTAALLPELSTTRRVRKANASTRTELTMFQKSSGLPLEKLEQEMILMPSSPTTPQHISKLGLTSVIDSKNFIAQDMADSNPPFVQLQESEADQQENETESTVQLQATEGQISTDKGTQLDSDSLPDSQEKPVTEVTHEESPIVMIKNEDGTITGTVAVPFINVPMIDDEMQGLLAVVKDEIESAELEAQSSVVASASITPSSPSFSLLETVKKPKLPATRGRKRGRHGYRGRGRRRKLREVLSDSDPELIQEPDDADMLDLISAASSFNRPGVNRTTDSLDLCKLELEGNEAENETLKDLGSEPASSQEPASLSSSATDTTVSTMSEGGDAIKEELPEPLTRTRGRKPITSVMASWTSPRLRAGIPRSVFRSDYVMHSLIRRSRHTGALHPSALENNELDYDEDENEALESCDALSKSLGEAPSGMDSSIKFVCQTCDFTTTSFRLYRQHMKRHPETDTRSYTCTECNFHTTKARQLLQHRKKHLHEDLICSFCEIQLDSQDNFEEHLERHAHSLPYFCHVCDMRFKTRTQLTTHQPKHKSEKPFVCQICGNGFKWKHALKSHMVTHSATKDHLCDICGFATAHKSQLKAHRLIHTGDTFKCSEPGCAFEATKRQNLKYHMVTHTQEKAHQCEVCGQAFSLIKNMRRHMLLHNDTRPFHCSVCTYTSTRYDKLKEHKLKQHAIGQPPGKKMKFGTVQHLAHGAITIAEDGTVVRSMEGLHMVPMEPITIAQDGNNITIRSDVTLTDEALQTIAQIATASSDATQDGGQPQEAQINISTSEGIPIIARVQFTSNSDPDVVNYVTQVQE